jgi:hypothetical protein
VNDDAYSDDDDRMMHVVLECDVSWVERVKSHRFLQRQAVSTLFSQFLL